MEKEKKPGVRGRSRKRQEGGKQKKKIPVLVASAVAAVLILGSGIYLFIGSTYKDTFFAGTVINGQDASGMTVDEVKTMISREISSYELTLLERDGKQETITREQLGLMAEFDGTLEKILEEQNPYAWLPAQIKGSEYEIPAMVVYEEENMEKVLKNLDCMDEEQTVKPENARISQYIPGTGYVIEPETEGNEVDYERFQEAVVQAVTELKGELSLEEAGVYVEPEIRAEDETLQTLLEQYNRYGTITVTYTFGDKKEVLDGETISQWLYAEGDEVIISDEAVTDYVQTLATKYNTAYRAKSLKTSYGPTVVINRGHYGWKIDQAAEKKKLMEILKAGESVTREPEYSQKAASHGANDYGDTYVEINLTAQHLFFYKDGKLLVESDFVSGNASKGWTTPPGAFPITYKERNATLDGEGYSTPVSYWMPFNGGIGMHDASWRSSFGGTIYKTNGSHGCINLPPAVAKTIYENISQGDPVLCYELAGTEQSSTSGKDGQQTQESKPAESKPAETKPAETQPAETKPAETQPAETKPAETQPAETKPAETQPAETKPAEPGLAGGDGGNTQEKGPGTGL